MSGRPRSFDRDEALHTALRCFWNAGYERTSVAGLTDAIGISPPSLYAAFGDKQQLFDEAAARYVAVFRAGLDERLDDPSTSGALGGLLRSAAELHTDPTTPAGCLVLSEPRLAGERDRLRERVAARVRRGREAGELPAEIEPEAIASFLEAILVGMSERARAGAGRDEVRGIAETAQQALRCLTRVAARAATRTR